MTEYIIMSIRMPEDLKTKIQRDADKELRSFTAQVNMILNNYYEGKKK